MKRLWAPWRMTYIDEAVKGRTEDTSSDCFFCAALDSTEHRRHLTVARTPSAVVMLNKYPLRTRPSARGACPACGATGSAVGCGLRRVAACGTPDRAGVVECVSTGRHEYRDESRARGWCGRRGPLPLASLAPVERRHELHASRRRGESDVRASGRHVRPLAAALRLNASRQVSGRALPSMRPARL